MAATLTRRLQGVLALVTGGGSGIGRAVSARLAREGALVAVADRDAAGAAETLRGLPAGAHQALEVDVGCARSVAELMVLLQTRFSRPASVCVNCAGITADEFLLKQTEEAFDAVLRVNLKGTFLVTQAVAQALVACGGASGGSIINIGSIVGKVGNLGQVNYAASKAGVEALSKTAAKELARYGIRCNAVLPGFIRSPMTDKVPQKVLDKFAAMVPLGRLGEPEGQALTRRDPPQEACWVLQGGRGAAAPLTAPLPPRCGGRLRFSGFGRQPVHHGGLRRGDGGPLRLTTPKTPNTPMPPPSEEGLGGAALR